MSRAPSDDYTKLHVRFGDDWMTVNQSGPVARPVHISRSRWRSFWRRFCLGYEPSDEQLEELGKMMGKL